MTGVQTCALPIYDEHWQEESTETWQPEILQIMNDHGFSPEDFKEEEEEELNMEEEPKGEFVIFLRRFYSVLPFC